MKAASRIVLSLAFLTLITAAAQPAWAICAAPFIISTLGDYTSYVVAPGYCPPRLADCTSDLESSVSSDLRASFWHVGNGNPTPGLGTDNGSFAALGNWVIYQDPGGAYAGYPAYIDTTWGASQQIDGCIDTPQPGGPPEKCMAVLLADRDGTGASSFALLTAGADDNGNFFLYLDGGETINLAAMPRPQILQTGRVGLDNISVTVAGPTLEALSANLHQSQDPNGLCAGAAGAVSEISYRMYTMYVPRGSMPPTDLDPANWIPGPTAALGETVEFVVCDQYPPEEQIDAYLAYALVFDSGFETPFVSGGSPSTTSPRIECIFVLADPGRIRIKEENRRERGTRTRSH